MKVVVVLLVGILVGVGAIEVHKDQPHREPTPASISTTIQIPTLYVQPEASSTTTTSVPTSKCYWSQNRENGQLTPIGCTK